MPSDTAILVLLKKSTNTTNFAGSHRPLAVLGWHFTFRSHEFFMHSSHPFHFNLVAAAHAAMIEHGFQPDFPAGTDTELAAIQAQPAAPAADGLADLRNLLWSSIDNDTSKDLDQIEWAEQLPDGRIRVLVGVADVDARVRRARSSTPTRRARRPRSTPASRSFPCCPPSSPRASPR